MIYWLHIYASPQQTSHYESRRVENHQSETSRSELRLIELISIASLFLCVGLNTRSEIYLQLTRNKVPRWFVPFSSFRFQMLQLLEWFVAILNAGTGDPVWRSAASCRPKSDPRNCCHFSKQWWRGQIYVGCVQRWLMGILRPARCLCSLSEWTW